MQKHLFAYVWIFALLAMLALLGLAYLAGQLLDPALQGEVANAVFVRGVLYAAAL